LKALIIASGEGKRLRGIRKDKPKPLVKLLGLSLIERAILSLRRVGVREVVIVLGYLKEKIQEELGDGSNYGMRISYLYNEEWQKGNGISVLKGKEAFASEKSFLLLMADHVFDCGILQELIKREVREGGILCVDKSIPVHIDLEDATKVKVEGDKILDIGKGLEDYNAIDTGIFLLTPDIFHALEESIKLGDDSLSGGVKVLARVNKMKALDVSGKFWMDIDTEEDYKRARKLMLKNLVKITDGLVSKYLNRPISIRLSSYLVNTNLTPNMISFFSFLLCCVSAIFYILGTYLNVLIGGILAQISSIIDGCDGEIARLKFQESEYGAWFDAVLDRYVDALVIFGMSYGGWLVGGGVKYWIWGIIALVGSFMNSYTASKYDVIFIREKKPSTFRFGRDTRFFIIFIGSIFNMILWTLIILGIVSNFESIRRLFVLKKCLK
jgi:CDP-L-myo-inositol myo-inositolphosphotransferase